MSTVFNDTALLAALDGVSDEWAEAPLRRPLEILSAVYGQSAVITEYDYCDLIRVYVVTRVATHRAFFIDTTSWHSEPSKRVAAVAETFGHYEEAANLLTVAAAFTEDGYLDRKAGKALTPADRFVLTLLRRWREARTAAGDDWDLATATVFTNLVDAKPVVPYLPTVYGC